MLQEAQNDAPEPGNLNELRAQEPPIEHDYTETNYGGERVVVDVNIDRGHDLHEHHRDEHHPQQNDQNEHLLPNNMHRNSETYQSYLMLATMLKYLNNGNAFAENHMED